MNGCAIIKAIPRFERFLQPTVHGCRLWTGAQTRGSTGRYIRKKRHKGKPRPNNGPKYGKFWVGPGQKDTVQAHVFAAFLAGKIPSLRVPAGMHLDHTCQHGSLCVDCTELVTAQRNAELAKQRPIRAHHAPCPVKRRKRRKAAKRRPGNPVKVSRQQKRACSDPPNA